MTSTASGLEAGEDQNRAAIAFLGAVLAGAVVSVLLGVYGRQHDPVGQSLFTLGFSGTLNMKAWLATLMAVLAIVQVVLAAWLYGKIGRAAPEWVGPVHRLVGTLTFLVSLPIAYHCLWSLGFETDSGETRRFLHSILGCAFYGAFTVKVVCVRSSKMPSWALQAVGGLLFAAIVGLWFTSSLWFFQNNDFPELLMDTLKEVVKYVQAITALAAVSFVILLFVNEPQKPPAIPKEGTEDAGATIYATRCASCHGADGGGGFGPTLGGGLVVQLYPNAADEIAVVANGRGSMPSFSDSLTAEQIAAVVEFTRTGLG